MIEITTIAWGAAGLIAGLLHATMLRRATQQLTAWTPVLGLLRLGVVAAVLVLAALSGEILAAAAGWTAGFITTSVWIVLRRTSAAVPATKTGPSE